MDVKNILIAGAGTMGYSIGEIFCEYGYSVTLYDVSDDALKKAKEYITINQKSLGKTTDMVNSITFTSDKEAFRSADMVIECIIENVDVKSAFYTEISTLVRDDTILASNTSGLSINVLAKAVHRPERFIGMHWFNPSNLVLLIEIIKGDKTDDNIAELIYNLCIMINKKPVIVNKDVPGFVGNRIQFAILREALSLVDDGVVSSEGIDDVMKFGLGFRYACAGPLQIADFGGLDIFYHISEYLMKDLNSDKGVPRMLDKLYKEGNFGVKTGKGFYDYAEGKDEEAISERNMKMKNLYSALYK